MTFFLTAREPLEQTDSPFELALAEYQAACAERDRLVQASGNEWTPQLSKARLEELRAWIALKQLAWLRLES